MNIEVSTFLKGKTVLITGGTGSFGRFFVRVLLRSSAVKKVIVFSRDELKQFEMQQELGNEPRIRFFIGDVRDRDRLYRAFEKVDYVVHAAALKQVPAAEYNPLEAIKTNVIGAQNVIDAAIDRGVSRVVALSTDKAAAPINLYGATKLCSDKLFVAANNFRGDHDIRFSVVRYGNVMGSRGSVIPFFLERRRTGVLPVTDERMTRFSIPLREGVDLVLQTLGQMWGGEIFVPRIPSYRVTDVAAAVGPECKQTVVGIRPGEKLHEEMITETDGLSCLKFSDYFTILPAVPLWDADEYCRAFQGARAAAGFSYSSDKNTEWLSIEQIRRLIVEHVDPSFVA
ncbi:MAG TPA: UDP-N-acetylglucosamine 4,6-dehydratase (inverting) [Opitutaceae bacterium]|nr:UDP-N-acetylglucosamine 4,6-dehydratase (inverting) [Opitutaceae bacterium]